MFKEKKADSIRDVAWHRGSICASHIADHGFSSLRFLVNFSQIFDASKMFRRCSIKKPSNVDLNYAVRVRVAIFRIADNSVNKAN